MRLCEWAKRAHQSNGAAAEISLSRRTLELLLDGSVVKKDEGAVPLCFCARGKNTLRVYFRLRLSLKARRAIFGSSFGSAGPKRGKKKKKEKLKRVSLPQSSLNVEDTRPLTSRAEN